MSAEVPTLHTDRLVLRAHQPTDLDDCAAMRADPIVTRHIGGVLDREETWSRLLRSRGHWSVMGYGFWVVAERASGRFVGEVGFQDFKRDLQPSLGDAPEMGWVLASWAHGRGYATEACTAALAWLQAHHQPERVVCIVAADNHASMKVAHKCGFQPSGQTTYKGTAIVLFERRAGTAET